VYLGAQGRKSRVVSLQPYQARYLLSLEGCETRESAESLRGESMECPLEDLGPLPEGTYFRWQIVGLRAVTDDGGELGEIIEVFSTGANDIYEVQQADGRRVLLPAISSVVREVDLDGGVVRIHLLPGLIDPA
jgi:16S rRNA processing protein RimM